jgi:proteasome lid subunit RPN8/RPN11
MKLPKAALAHAEAEYPRESCGVVVGRRYFPCRNIAETPEEHFQMHPDDYRQALEAGEPTLIIHSHPDYPCRPSDADRLGCEESGLPWGIIEVYAGKATQCFVWEPSGFELPLMGRPFIHGLSDCLSVVLDYYKRERGVDLGAYTREDDWWHAGKDYYRELLPAAGFAPVSGALQQGDVVLMQIRAPVPNHAGVYLADGILQTEPQHYPAPGCILHHMYGQDSKRDPYGGYWLEKTVSIWRYVGKT